MEGSRLGTLDGDKLINELYVSLGLIKAGNTSTKLRKWVVDKHISATKDFPWLYSIMAYHLLLDSNLAKLQRNNHNQESYNFTIHLHPPIRLEQTKNYKAALNKLITMSYSWYNIAEAYGNNKLKWRKKPGDWQTLIFPDGMYGCADINRFLHTQTGLWTPMMKAKGAFSTCSLTSLSTAGLWLWWTKIMSLISLREGFPVYLDTRKRFWKMQRILKDQWFLT